MEDNRCWESGMRVNIPEFDGDTLNPRGFIDWLVAVEEVFEFKEVPENKRVSLIATKLRGRASTWWQQLKLTRKKVEKLRVTSWMKMKKLMRTNFILHNYQRLMYQRLQNLKQGTKSVEDYTTEFYQLIARNDIQETGDQLVSHYIDGLRVQIMDFVNMFDPVTLSDAYQRALAFEKQSRRVGSSSSLAITRGGSCSSNVASHFVPNQAKSGGGSGLKCFNYGKTGHRQSECKKAGKRTLFAEPEEWEDDGVANDDYTEAPVFDDDQYEEEVVTGDVGVNLMVRRSCLTPQAVGDDWLKHNIFQSTCTILGKVCIFVVDPGSCDNLIAEEAVQKLGLKTENRPKHYKLQWLKKGTEVTVSKRVLVTFSVGTTYKDSVWCDMVPMDTYHLLLGRPWEYDRNTTHNGRANTYSFLFGGVKITLMPNKPKELVNKPTGTLLTLSQFEDELEMGDEVHRAVHDNLVRGNSKYKQDADQVDFEVGDFMWAVLTKDRFSVGEYNKLSTKKIGPLEIIEKIDSNAYRSKLPSHIRCSDVFNVKNLLPYHGDSSDDDLVVNSRANFIYPRGNDAGASVEEQALLFMEARHRLKKKPFLKWHNLGSETPFQAQDQPIQILERGERRSNQHIGIRAKVPVKMPPKRNRPLTKAYKQEFEQRVMVRMEEQLDQFVDQLADRMNDMMNPRIRRDHNRRGSEGEESENPFFDCDDVFEFKEVPENKRVSLITTKLLGRAFAWWQQFKLTRERVGNPRETDDQLVSCYIDGLRVQTMDSVNMFDPVTLSDAYQRALAFEKNRVDEFGVHLLLP
ncbi:putative nucleotidyltransferase, ribonuclease H [Tanacetum coccineum]